MEGNYKYNIGIAVTVHNRHETANITIKNIKKFLPKGALFVIVDDASDTPYPNATFRFETQAGIAKAKNKCFELLDECEHIVLFDDDCYPKIKGWEKPYIESKYPHLMYIFSEFSNGKPNGNRKSHEIEDAVVFTNPCGCFIYYHHSCLDAVGGMDEGYGIWGFDHPDHSVRIHNAGLTPYPFMDVKGSDDLFFSYDKEQTIERSVSASVRAAHIRVNQIKYAKLGKSSAYIPFKEAKGIVLTTYLTGCIDPQRGQKWNADIEQCRVLAESVKRHNTDLVVLNDCFEPNQLEQLSAKNARVVVKHENPYFSRWIAYRDYLRLNPSDNVFLVDCNDVELLRHPFRNIQPNKIYVGWEKEVIGCQWMLNHHKSNFGQIFIKCNMKTPLLNAGVIGGRYEIVMEFLDRIYDMIGILPDLELDSTDMMLFNWILYSHFNGRFETGQSVCSTFKAFDYKNKQAIWRHK